MDLEKLGGLITRLMTSESPSKTPVIRRVISPPFRFHQSHSNQQCSKRLWFVDIENFYTIITQPPPNNVKLITFFDSLILRFCYNPGSSFPISNPVFFSFHYLISEFLANSLEIFDLIINKPSFIPWLHFNTLPIITYAVPVSFVIFHIFLVNDDCCCIAGGHMLQKTGFKISRKPVD